MNQNVSIRLGVDPRVYLLVVRVAYQFTWVVSIGFTAWLCVNQFWRFAIPYEYELPFLSSHEPIEAVDSIIGRNPFVSLVDSNNQKNVTQSVNEYVLSVVVAGSMNHPGWAVFVVPGGAQTGVIEGAELKRGLKLDRVYADRVILKTNNGLEAISIVDKSALLKKITPSTVTSP